MSGKPASFKQADVTRAVRAAKAAGIEVGRVEVFPNGRIAVYAAGSAAVDDLDEEMAAFRARNPWCKST